METKPSPAIAPVPFAVTLQDGSVCRFLIKPLTITKLYDWLYLAKDQREPAMVAMACGKDLAWVDSLDEEQFGKLAGKCHEVIFPQALRLSKGAPAAAALVAPILQQNLLGLRVIAALSIGSGDSSPTPLPRESAAETPNASPTPIPSTDSAKSSPTAAENKPAAS
jgi:hypothetical protein